MISIYEIPFGMVKSFLIKGDADCILIDAGVPDSTASFLQKLAEIGIDPADIKLIVVTHAHWDHIGSIKEIKEHTGAKIIIHYREKEWLETGITPSPPGITTYGKILGRMMRLMPEKAVSPVQADIVLTDDGLDLGSFGISGKVVHTPGHTVGSLSVILETGEAFVGDLAMSAKFMRLAPGVPIVGDDIDLIYKSWQVLLDFGAETIYPAHGKPFSADVFHQKMGK